MTKGKRGNGGIGVASAEVAPAKLNLSLRIPGLEPRASGLHRIRSLVVFPEIGDLLTVTRDRVMSLRVTGDKKVLDGFSSGNTPNLVIQAANALNRNYGGAKHGASMKLTKHIPVGSGLGGGSADAAATLRALKTLWNIQCSESDLCNIGKTLGSDVAACLERKAVWVSGIGDKLTPIRPVPGFWVLLVYPDVPVLTAKAFSWLAKRQAYDKNARCPAGGFASLDSLVSWMKHQGNSFDSVILDQVPECAVARRSIEETGALVAAMSGSGSTQFGIYAEQEEAEAACARLTKEHHGWWIAAARVAPVK